MSVQYWYGKEDASTVVLGLIQRAENVDEAREIVKEDICRKKQKLIKIKNRNVRSYQRGLIMDMKEIYNDSFKFNSLQEFTDCLKDMEMDMSNIRKIEI